MQNNQRESNSDNYTVFYKQFVVILFKKVHNNNTAQEKKKNYSLSDNYHLIILENTIIKLFKKIVTEHITNIAEKYDLLI